MKANVLKYNGQEYSTSQLQRMVAVGTVVNVSLMVRKAKVRGVYEGGAVNVDLEFSDLLLNSKMRYDYNLTARKIASKLEPTVDFNGMEYTKIYSYIIDKYNISTSLMKTLNDYSKIMKLIDYLLGTPLESLIKRSNAPVQYNGATYQTSLEFYHGLKIMKKTLLLSILEYDGDYHKAILNCRDDPEFGVVVKPVINGVSYTSVSNACEALGIHYKRYKDLYRKHKDFDLAYQEYLETARTDAFKNSFPFGYNGTRYLTPMDLANYLGITERGLEISFSIHGGNLSLIIENKIKQRAPYGIPNTDIRFSGVQEIADTTGYTVGSIMAFTYNGNSGSTAYLTYLSDTLIWKGNVPIFSSADYIREFGLPKSYHSAIKEIVKGVEEPVRYTYALGISKKINIIKPLLDAELFNRGLSVALKDISINYKLLLELIYSDISPEDFYIVCKHKKKGNHSDINRLLKFDKFYDYIENKGFFTLHDYASANNLNLSKLEYFLEKNITKLSVESLETKVLEYARINQKSSIKPTISDNIFE